jgi:tRNA pseudouridine38-40 synthase
MPVYRLILAYDGSGFSGWQRQPGRRCIQSELESALAVLAREPVAVQGAGRTDAGVHALGQCASFKLERAFPEGRLLAALRGLLPEDVSPLSLARSADGFNARFSALGRHYQYRLSERACAPFRRLRWELPFSLDLAAMGEALEPLRGARQWRGFCTPEASAKGAICRLTELALEPWGDEIRLRIGADRFLHHMVRIIVGTLVEIGRGRWRPDRVAQILAEQDRTLAGPTAPAHGLYLMSVDYPPELLAPAAEAEA